MPKQNYLIWGVFFLIIGLLGCSGLMKANSQLDQGKYEAAIPLYQGYLAENPGSAEARLGLGLAYLETGRYDQSIDALETMLETDSCDPNATLYLGRAYLRKGAFDEAVVLLQDYKNGKQPLIEEAVQQQLPHLEAALDQQHSEEKRSAIASQFETAVKAAKMQQDAADKAAMDISGERDDGGRGDCFAYDTHVLMADQSLRRIIDLRAGDKVLAYDIESDGIVTREVTDTYRADQDHYYLINGGLRITAYHPVFTVDYEWVEVADLKAGDKVISKDGVIEIASIQRVPYDHRVYNFEVADSHNYFVSAGGKSYLVHN